MHYLYDFRHYDGAHSGTQLGRWLVTGYAQAYSHSGLTYQPLEGLQHDALTFDQERTSGSQSLTVPRDFGVAELFRAGYPRGSVHVKVIEIDEGAAYVVYQGRVRSADFGELTATLRCTDGAETLARLGLRINGGQQCQWQLYSAQCGVNKSAHADSGTVTSVSADGLTVNVSGVGGVLMGGQLTALGQVRMITSNNGGALRLMSHIPGLTAGTPVTVHRGCDKTTSANYGCRSFNNIARFSGFEGFVTPANIFSEGAGGDSNSDYAAVRDAITGELFE